MGVVYTIHRLVMLTGCCEWQRKGFYTALVTCAQKSAKFSQNHELKSQGRQRAGHILQYRVGAALLRIVCIELFGTSVHRFIIRCRQKIDYRDRVRRSWPT